MNPASAYARTQAETASRERLTVLLFEAALKLMRSGAAAIEEGRPAEAVKPLTRASDIVAELSSCLDRARAPELCDRLASVYEFVALRLTDAALRRDAKPARDAERAFAPITDAFATAVAKVGAPR